MRLFLIECKQNRRMTLIWAITVGVLCGGCLLLYGGLEESMEQMSQAYASMGAFSTALGMDKISVGTLEGFYAIELSIMLGLGGAMFAAMLGASLIAKEEEGHTSEFLNTLPIGRGKIILQKYLAMLYCLILFHVICVVIVLVGFACMGEMADVQYFITYHLLAFMMSVEIGSICFLVSSFTKKKQVGGAIGVALILYGMDLLCRILPDLEKMKYLTPFYYSNGADIFSGDELCMPGIVIGGVVIVACFVAAEYVYTKRDLAA